MEQIIREAIITTYFAGTGALIVIWLGTMLSLFRFRTTGYVSKREKISRHNKERLLPSHDASSCTMCEEMFVCKHDFQELCGCFKDFMCEQHAR